MRIAVVDDEDLCRGSLVEELRIEFPEARIDEYDDGLPAWEAIQQDHDIDLVITDMRMVKMDGINLAARINGKYPDIQILFETAESESTLRQLGVQLERCLLKPVIGQELKEKIDHLSDLPKFAIKVPAEEGKIQTSKNIGGFFSRLLQRC